MKDSLLIGCIPSSVDFTHPQDRRRYIPYFKNRGIAYEVADYDKYYEILYISLNSDLNRWAHYKKKQLEINKEVRVVFDLSDLYLAGRVVSDRLRPIFHFLSGRTSSLRTSYKKTILDMLSGTDVLICGSDEQKKFLDDKHHNVVVVRDYFLEDITSRKNNYELLASNEIHILWEGLSHGNISIFKMMKNILKNIRGFKINLHIITDSEYCKVGGKYLCKPTYSVLKEVFSGTDIRFHLYDWNAATFSSIASSCDIALIPIPENPIMQGKPENKLLLLWSLGLPVITTNTKSYTRVMHAINEDFICATNEEWQQKLLSLVSSTQLRERYMKSAAAYLDKNCSAESIFNTYDKIFFG